MHTTHFNTTFINLTPHPIRIRVGWSKEAEVAPCDLVIQPRKSEDGKVLPARVGTTPGTEIGNAVGVALYGRTTFGAVEGLPDPEKDTIYIVSGMVAGRVVGREDVYSPGTGPNDGAIRSAEGQIFAVTRLIQA